MNARVLFGVMVVGLSSVGLLPAQPPGGDKPVQSVLSDWNARLDRFKSVRYRLSGVIETVSKAEVPVELKDEVVPAPPGPKERPLKVTLLIDIANRRSRLEVNKPTPSKVGDRWVPGLTVSAYNGKAYQTAYPRASNDRGPDDPDVSIAKGNLGTVRTFESYLRDGSKRYSVVVCRDGTEILPE